MRINCLDIVPCEQTHCVNKQKHFFSPYLFRSLHHIFLLIRKLFFVVVYFFGSGKTAVLRKNDHRNEIIVRDKCIRTERLQYVLMGIDDVPATADTVEMR